MNPVPLDPIAIAAALRIGLRAGLGGTAAPAPRLGREIRILEETASTNDALLAEARTGAAEGLALYAESQTAGRGRNGAPWSAPPRHNLTFSILLEPRMPVSLWPRFAHAAGIAVARGVEPWLGGQAARLKWPNDVYVDGRKLAGILLETHHFRERPFAILGIGVNVNSPLDAFPAGLRPILISVRAARGGEPVDRNDLAGSILAELNHLLDLTEQDFPALLPEMERRSLLLHRPIRFREGPDWQEGVAAGFGANGELLVVPEPGHPPRALLNADAVRLIDPP